MRPVAAALLAAGLGTRFGGRKPLARLGGRPLVTYAARQVAQAGYAERLAVLPGGQAGEELADWLRPLGFRCLLHPRPEAGLLSSFQLAAQAEPAGEALCFVLGDMPFVSLETHAMTLRAFSEQEPPWLRCVFGPGEVQAPPLVLRRDLWPALLALPPADQGPRELMRAHAKEGLTLRRPQEELFDTDTPAALAEAEERLREWS